jgi:hypothetical protein
MDHYAEKTMEYFKAIKEGRGDFIELRNKIVELNIRLVSQVLKKYKPYTADQFQNGCLGLITAANTYELMREVPFSSYACFCINRELQKAHKMKMEEIESQVNSDNWVYLDAQRTLSNGDTTDNYDICYDEHAEQDLMKYIEDNELSFISENIIKPCIQEVADRGKHMQTKIDVSQWQRLEFLYIMDLVFLDSQKQRLNLSQMSMTLGVAVQNVRMRHERVMENIFQRMWIYMTVGFNDLFERLRGQKKVPDRLLCLDPGKTTGWCVFEKGILTKTGHVENCYDDENIDTTGLLNLFEEVKPDFVLYEDYRVYESKLERHANNPVYTLRLIGTIEAYCQMNKLSHHRQMATTAKNFVTDDKLKSWGFWQTGMRHARDAIRHGCYFLLFYKKGQDIE